ncbi:MAG: EscN/YscN/HrcN family type III secretion system ATPase, partial [Deltaproteobacteria bacterium]|nr:EscN/YscN/HrcN family type III secretion system ATPase [Deltaproteobacteria bacterium]
DGHIVLSRRLADRNIFPAIDPLSSKSRVMIDVVRPEQRQHAGELLNLMAAYQEAEDLINIGAYAAGSNPRIDRAIALHEKILNFLRQQIDQPANFADSVAQLKKILQK